MAKKKAAPGPMVPLSIRVQSDLHRRFKSAATLDGKKLQEGVAEAMEEWLERKKRGA